MCCAAYSAPNLLIRGSLQLRHTSSIRFSAPHMKVRRGAWFVLPRNAATGTSMALSFLSVRKALAACEIVTQDKKQSARKPMSDDSNSRAMEMLCRQRAKADPEHGRKWLGQADRWHNLGKRETAWRFQRNTRQQMHAGPMATQPNSEKR